MLTVSFWGFDATAHQGRLVVHREVVGDVTDIFRRLYDAHFPIRSMVPMDAFGASDDASMAADNTSGFNCRAAVAAGPSQWSAHAYGRAIDVDPVENPYVEGGQVRPPAGSPYVDRSARPGVITAGGATVRAFAASGWSWGGRWSGTPDYQHFSSTGT